jgi:hypothetical protein
MRSLVAFAVFLLAMAVWVTVLRPWLRVKPWARGFFDAIEPIEIRLWNKSESILWARTLQLTGVVLAALTFLNEQNLEPLMQFVPDGYKWVPSLLPMIISVVGAVNEVLRRDTTKPLAVVALPSALPADVAATVAKAENATNEAVAAAEAVKASPDA